VNRPTPPGGEPTEDGKLIRYPEPVAPDAAAEATVRRTVRARRRRDRRRDWRLEPAGVKFSHDVARLVGIGVGIALGLAVAWVIVVIVGV